MTLLVWGPLRSRPKPGAKLNRKGETEKRPRQKHKCHLSAPAAVTIRGSADPACAATVPGGAVAARRSGPRHYVFHRGAAAAPPVPICLPQARALWRPENLTPSLSCMGEVLGGSRRASRSSLERGVGVYERAGPRLSSLEHKPGGGQKRRKAALRRPPAAPSVAPTHLHGCKCMHAP